MIQHQLNLEREMINTGLHRYQAGMNKSVTADRGAETGYASTLIQKYVEPVGGYLMDRIHQTGAGRRNKYYGLLKNIDPYMAAYLALRGLFNYFMSNKALVAMAVKIGQTVEDQLKFERFEKNNPKYYQSIIKDFKRKNTKSYSHKHKVLTVKLNEAGVEWNDWTAEERLQVGMILLDCVLMVTDLAEKKYMPYKNSKFKETLVIVPTQACRDWIHKYVKYAEVLHPDRLPCIIQPEDWTSLTEGGYYLPPLRKKTPMVNIRNKEHLDMLSKAQISSVMSSINFLQSIPHRINKRVLEAFMSLWEQGNETVLPRSTPYIIPESPVPADLKKENMTPEQLNALNAWKSEAAYLYGKERERSGKALSAARILRTGVQYSQYEQFYFVWQADFRGRLYAISSGINPQGHDFNKGLLEFAIGKEVTEESIRWLEVHGANQYGVDKVSFEDRCEWIHQNIDRIQYTARNPEASLDFWGSADNPFQFLAFCFEYAEWIETGKLITHIPVSKDGSCNGIQHFSAMLRDEESGKHVNLVPGDKPADIYSVVAERASELVNKAEPGLEKDLLQSWLNVLPNNKLPRSLAKKPVMTLPYGATVRGMIDSVCESLMTDTDNYFNKPDCFKLALFLTPMVWDSINVTCNAARSAMDWLQESSAILARAGLPTTWITPVGFPVYQNRKKSNVLRIVTKLCGTVDIRLAQDSAITDVRAQRRGVAPNFVHSLDATHLIYTIQLLKSIDNKINLIPVHDSYAVHCTDIDLLDACIRESFILLYNHNILNDYKIYIYNTYNITLPDIPNIGNLDINTVRDSRYFFN